MVGRKEAEVISENVEQKGYRDVMAAEAFRGGYIVMAEAFYNVQPYFYDENKIWWLWNFNTYSWDMFDDIELLNRLRNILTNVIDITKGGIWNQVLKSMMLVGRTKKPEDIESNWIQFKENIYDIKTGKVFKSTPKYFVTNPIDIEMGESEDTPTIDLFFEQWVGAENKIQLYEILSYCCLPDYPIHRIFCFTGGGSNGKSKYLDLIERFIGKRNCTSSDLDSLMTKSFETAKLYKKLICQMGETNFNVMTKTGILKRLTGQDMIGFELKNKNPFDGKNYAKIIISTNQLPSTTDKTTGFYRRWMIIDFPNEFTELKGLLDRIPEEEYKNLAKKSLRILKELLERNGAEIFTNEGDIKTRAEKYEAKSNPLENFLKDNTEEDLNDSIFKFELRNRFLSFCKERRFREWSDIEIAKYMKDHNIKSGRKSGDWNVKEGNKLSSWTTWDGIKWKGKSEEMSGMSGMSGYSNSDISPETESEKGDIPDIPDIQSRTLPMEHMEKYVQSIKDAKIIKNNEEFIQ